MIRTSDRIVRGFRPAVYCFTVSDTTVHCKLDKVGHGSLCPPRNGTGVVLLEAGMCRVSLKEMSGSSYLSPYLRISKTVQFPHSCCIPVLFALTI